MTHEGRPAPSRRRLTRLVGLVGAAAVVAPLVACGTDEGGAAATGETLTVWGIVSFTREGDRELGDQMEEWGNENGVDVAYEAFPGNDYPTKMAAAIASGSLPDVMMLRSTDPIFYGGQGHLEPLDDLSDEVRGLGGGMWPAMSAFVEVDETVYGIPMQADMTVLYARIDAVEQVLGERRAPTTLDEMEQVALEAQDPPQTYGIALPMGNSTDGTDLILPIIYAEGGRLVDEAGNPDIDNPGTIAALTRIKRWWDEGLIPQDALSSDDAWNNEQYLTGSSLFTYNAPSIMGAIRDSDPELLENTAQAPLPAGEAGSVQSVNNWSWGVSASSPNIDQAKALLRHIMEPESIGEVYEEVGGRWYPVYPDLANEPFWAEQSAFDDFPEIIDNASTDWAPAPSSVTLLTQIGAVRDNYLVPRMTQEMILGGKSPEETAAWAQAQMEQLFEQYGE